MLPAEQIPEVDLRRLERRDARPLFLRTRRGDTCNHAIGVAIELVGDQGPVLGPDQPVPGHAVVLQQQEEGQRVLALMARGDDLTDPVRDDLDDPAGALGQAFLAPPGEVMARTLMGLVVDADLASVNGRWRTAARRRRTRRPPPAPRRVAAAATARGPGPAPGCRRRRAWPRPGRGRRARHAPPRPGRGR